jgi:nucleoredoxin
LNPAQHFELPYYFETHKLQIALLLHFTSRTLLQNKGNTKNMSNHLNENSLAETLGTILITTTGQEIDTSALACSKKLVLLYFSAHWCPPCRGFTPLLSKAYQEYQEANHGSGEIEVVFVSWDKDEESFLKNHRAHMTFPAIPHQANLGRKLAETYGVRGIPSLVAVNPSTGESVYDAVDLRSLIAKNGASAFSPDRICEEDDLVAFFNACMNGADVAAVQSLLQKYSDIANRPSPEGWHDRYIRRGGWQPVGNDNPGVKNVSGKMYLISSFPAFPLQLAAGNGHSGIVKLLLEAGASLEAADGDGDTALAWATWCGRREIMNQLLGAGADVSFSHSMSGEQFEAINGDVLSLEYLKDKSRPP